MLRATPPGEDGLKAPKAAAGEIDQIENVAQRDADSLDDDDTESDGEDEFNERPTDAEFLQMVSEADTQASYYSNQVNRRSWERVYRAFHQQHFNGSKYEDSNPDYRNRSRLFIPKTRSAIKKDLAAVAASLFGSIDAVNCMPGNESDKTQAASAAVVQELVNYRTDRSSGKASIPWFHIAMGARQTSLLTGFCVSKQSWKLELKRKGSEKFKDDPDDEDEPEKERDVWVPYIDRPQCELFPPENVTIDPAADWTNPAQDAAYVLLKWPMRIDEIRRKQKDPRKPWKALPESVLRAAGEGAKLEASAIRRAREQGLDRYDESQTGPNFDIIWVWEAFIRTAGQDWTFLTIGGQHLLTDPEPVEEVYPEQFGERPLSFGYGAFEAFRIFPMSAAESWQMLQQETNDIRNLTLDAIKQNVMPVTKVVRGRNVDLDQLKRRGQGTSIMVTSPTDVTWEKAPDISGAVTEIAQSLNVEFDDLAGQQNYGTVQDNNQLGKTLGGLKLAAGAANSVQEFDIRIWIETWCEPVLAQIVRLEQYYESDPVVLGLCGDRAQLLEKFGVDQIDNTLLEKSVTIRVNIGLGAGDPQQRLAKFQSAVNVAMPLLEKSTEFADGSMTMDAEAVMQEVFGAAGYRDGGKRFVKKGAPKNNPMQQPQLDNLMAKTAKDKALAKAAIVNALANAAKVGLGQKELEDAYVDAQFQRSVQHMDQLGRAADLGASHADSHMGRQNAARGVGPDGQPLALPGPDGGGPPDDAAGGAPPSQGDAAGGIVPGPTDAGAGNAGLSADDLGKHGVPAGDAGQQLQQDQASEAANLAKATTPRTRKVSIAKRGPDGRASEFHIEDDRPAPQAAAPVHEAPAAVHKSAGKDHSQTIAQLAALVSQLNAPKKVVRENGKIVGLETAH